MTLVPILRLQYKNNQGICLWKSPFFCPENKKGDVLNVEVGGVYGDHFGLRG